jgi:UDP-2-acetamido-3-amino-2,3-dideoxy-glucuronate N-acetyltransferase
MAYTGTLARNIEVEDTGVAALKWRNGAMGSINVTMLTWPKNLEGSITILGERGTVRIGGVAVNEIKHWEFETPDAMDSLIGDASYETTSVYGFGHPLYYDNVISTLRGEAQPETDGREAEVARTRRSASNDSASICLWPLKWRLRSTERNRRWRDDRRGSRVWHWCTQRGRRAARSACSGNDVVIGDNVRIQNNVSVYDAVTLEDDVFCGPSMVFTNVYNPRSAVPRKDEYRRTLVKRGATLGANCTIVCGTTIGAYAFVGAGAVVQRDVPDFALVVGVPARHIGWMSRHGERLALPLSGDAEAACPATQERYRLRDGRCQLLTEPQ